LKRFGNLGVILSIAFVLILCFTTYAAFGTQEKVSATAPNLPLPTITNPPAAGKVFDPAPDSAFMTSHGYAQQEYFMSGTSSVYENTSTSGFAMQVRGGTRNLINYKTNILIRYPTDPTKFSGNVIVEFLNPTAGYNIATGWPSFRNHIVNNGDIWVGMTSRGLIINNATTLGAFGVNSGLVSFSPSRYNTLTFGGGTPIAGSTKTGATGWYQRAIVWDMFAQLGVLLKTDTSANPLHNLGFAGTLKPQDLIAHGYSQTGGYMITYINWFASYFDQLWAADLGGGVHHIFDAYNPMAAGGIVWINDDDIAADGQTTLPGYVRSTSDNTIKDLTVPVMHVNTESEVNFQTYGGGAYAFLSPVSTRKADTTLFRHYEVPGSAHITGPADLLFPAPSDQAAAYISCGHGCCIQPYSQVTDFPQEWAFDGMINNLEQWAANNSFVPPLGDIITTDTSGPNIGAIQRDGLGTVADQNGRFGNALGGYRTPAIEIPLEEYLPYFDGCTTCSTLCSACKLFCPLYGRSYTENMTFLNGEYGTTCNYIQEFDDDVNFLMNKGLLDPADNTSIYADGCAMVAAKWAACSLCNTAGVSGPTQASVSTSLGTVKFASSGGKITGLTNIPSSSLTCSTGGFIFPFGMFSYSLTNVAPGATVTVTIATPIPVPMGAKVFKCQNGILTDFSANSSQLDPNTFVLTLKDGGPGDADGVANGTIVDPCGPAFMDTSPHQSSAPQIPKVAQGPAPIANIAVQSASLSTAKVAPGTPVTITADVANKGTADGSTQIKLFVNGQEEAHQGVTLASGSRTPVKFTVSRDEPGTYSVYVGSIPAGTFEVNQFADPNLVLYISGALILLALVGGVVFMASRKQQAR
jgi:hypothetical protein